MPIAVEFLNSARFAAGSPTPDNLGLIEIFVGLLLILATTDLRLFQPRTAEPWRGRAQAVMLYGLTVPVAAGLAMGAAPVAMLRDIVPFLFMLLPFFIYVRPHPLSQLLVTGIVVAAGVIFAARAAAHPVIHWLMGYKPAMTDTLYLANAPTVLLAALLLLGLAGRALYTGATLRRLLPAAVMAALALIPLAAMTLAKQRAGLGAVAVYGGCLMLAAVIRRPVRALTPALFILMAAVLGGGVGLKIYHVLTLKTEMVGANMRWQEAAAVFDSLDENPLYGLFGKGWGAQIRSLAVGGETVNFTHSLLTSYWLKTGLCGLVLVLLYLFELGALLARGMRQYPLLVAAIALPMLIDVLLYASFKSLDFGLILLLIPLWMPEVASQGQKI